MVRGSKRDSPSLPNVSSLSASTCVRERYWISNVDAIASAQAKQFLLLLGQCESVRGVSLSLGEETRIKRRRSLNLFKSHFLTAFQTTFHSTFSASGRACRAVAVVTVDDVG